MSDFTPHPPGRRPYWEMSYVTQAFGKRIVWRYGGCVHHCREFIAASRAVGDKGTFYAFHTSGDTDQEHRFCSICAALEQATEPRFIGLINQTPVQTFEAPGQAAHNHITRDIKPKGQCPACDRYNLFAQMTGDAQMIPEDHDYEPGEDTSPMHTDPRCRSCGLPKNATCHD